MAEKKEKQNLSLNDLNIVKHTEIRLNDNFILPIKVDISRVCYDEVNVATLNMMKFYEKTKYTKLISKPQPKTININRVEIENDKIIYDTSELTYERELNDIRIEQLLKSYLKYTNTTDKLFEGKTILEYLECEDIYDYMIDNGLSNREFVVIQNNICFWIDYIAKDYMTKVNKLLELEDKKGTYYNQAMIELQIAYEHGRGSYFQENFNTACSEWSFREKILSKAYFTKKYLIDKAVDDEIKNSTKSSSSKK